MIQDPGLISIYNHFPVCPEGFLNSSATLPYCYAVSSDNIDELSSATDFCDSFGISAEMLTFDSEEHLQDFVSFYENEIDGVFQNVENTFLGYGALTDLGNYIGQRWKLFW